MKTKDLIGPALDLAISRANNAPERDGWGWFEIDAQGFLFDPLNEYRYSPSTLWEQGGPMLEEYGISLVREATEWVAWEWVRTRDDAEHFGYGDTPLIAGMRCFVSLKLGDEIEIPVELLRTS